MAAKKITRAEAKARGLKRYFTGEECSRGHIAERITANGLCTQCFLDYRRARRAEKPGYRTRAEIAAETASPTRQCWACKKTFPATTEFFIQLKQNLARECRPCRNKRFKPFYKKNRKRLIKKATIHKRKRREESEAVRQSDRISSRNSKRRRFADPKKRAKATARDRRWRKANPDRVKLFKHLQPPERRFRAALRYARKLNATPLWLTKDQLTQIRAVYAKADRKSVDTGKLYEVDHYYPLVNKVCSGLHVPWNLQIIRDTANQKKGNRLPIKPYRNPL